MASLSEIEDAIRKASAKGDKELVKKLGVHYNRIKAGNKDSSLGTALEHSFERMQKGSLNYTADLAEKAEDSRFGKAYNQVSDAVNENVFNPIRRVVGIDEVDANTAEAGNIGTTTFVNEARRKADAAGARADALNYETMTTKDVKNIPTALQFGVTKAAESLPYMTTGPLMLGAFIMPGEVNESLKEIEGLSPEKRLALASSGGAIMGVLERIGAVSVFKGVDPRVVGKLGVKGVLKKLQERGLTKIASAFARGAAVEGITEVGQENVQVAAENIAGKDFEDGEWFDRSKEAFWGGFAAGGTISGGGRTVTETGKGIGTVFKTGKDGIKSVIGTNDLNVDDKKAAASFAQRLDTIAQNNGYDLQDVDKMSTNGAYTALEGAHVDLVGKLNTFFARVKKAGLVDSKKAETLEEIEKAILAEVTQKQARNKTKGRVKRENFDALKDLVGDTGDGQILLNTIRELDILTQVHNNGYQGKLSSLTDTFAIFGSRVGYDRGVAITEKVLRPAGSLLAAKATGGTSLIPQLVAPSVGRAIDKYRGTYSSIDRFINQNKNNETLPAVDKPLIAEAQASEAAEAEAVQAELDASTAQFNRELGRENAPPTPTSPEGTVQEATGLNKQGIARVIRVLKSSKASNKPLMKAIKDYEESIDTGGFVGDLSPLIRQVKLFIKDNPNYVYDAPNVQTEIGGGFQPGGITTNTSSGYNRGIEDNKRFVGDLQQRANKDKSLSVTDRGQILTALDTMSRNLGSDPMTTSQQIHDKLLANDVNTQAVGMYVKPYVDRIANQQNTAPKLNEVVNETMEAPDIITRASQEFAVDQGPALEQSITNENILPTNEEVIAMRDGTFIPDEKRQLVEAADLLNERWKQITGREEPFEYTDENVEVISDSMAREAVNNLSKDGNAIGWYDRKIKAAKQVLSLIEPRINQSPEAEAAFDFALAVTSNGQAVEMNFEYAVDVFRQFMDTGSMPTNFKQGGERNAAMRTAFDFFNAYNTSAVNEPIQMFLDRDFTVATLNNTISQFNKKHGTNIKVPSSETVNTPVKGSYILGPKIGQGFYQNIRGNYEPLTMDIWWMRMWNRMVGRPFEATKSPKFMTTSRDKLATQIKKSTGLEKKLINETLKATNETKKGLYKDTVRFEKFIKALDKRYQRFYTQYKKDNGVNHTKPQLFKSTGTYTKNMVKQLQAQPTPADRPYMRRVTVRALEKLREQGIDITTADFQALMWYPEKLLYRKLGVQPGNGSDNDYLDAARLLAQKEGISNDQIQEALPQSERDGEVDNRTSTTAPNEGVYRDVSQSGNEGGGILTAPGSVRRSQDFPSGADVNGPTVSSQGVTQGQPIRGSFFPGDPPTAQDAKPFLEKAKSVFEIGKKGSPYEKGIGTIAEAKQLADALNVTLKLLDKIPEPYGKASGLFTIQGNQKGDLPGGIASVVKQGAPDPAYPNPITAPARTELEELFTALHELGHAIALPGVDREANLGYMLSDNPLLTEGNIEQVQIGSFESIVASLLETETIRVDIIDEIINLQENIDVTSERKPNLGSRFVRHHRAAIKNTQEGAYNKALSEGMLDPEGFATREVDKAQKRIEQNRTTYTRTISELATDALWVYMAAPKLMKEAAPETSKLIQEVFSTLGGPKQPMTFYTFPITAIMAGVLAMMAKGAEEDEERNRLMQAPPGALTPPPAALSGMMI